MLSTNANILREAGLMAKMRLGVEVCEELHIDFEELFCNEKICGKPAAGEAAKNTAEEEYLMLSPAARREVMDYMDGLLVSDNLIK